MPTISRLTAVISAETSGFDRGIQSVEGKLQKLGSKLTSVGVGLSAALTAPLLGLGARAARVAGDLQQSLNVLAATSGATGDQMRQLSVLAEQLGADIKLPGTSAADAAEAMLELSKGGLSVADTMASARSVLQLSAAAQVSNARAAEITADALASFGLAGTQAAQVADLLSGAANASTGSIDEMAQALGQSGASFRELGINITDATTAISLMAQAGIKGSDAGTSLKTVLSRLNPTTKEAKAAMERLHISFFDANGQFVGLRKSSEILHGALGRLSEQNRNAALSIIFGSDAMRAASILARAGADGFEQMRAKVSEAGSAAKLAAAQNAGLKGALDALQSSLDTALNAAVKPFLGDLENLAKRAADLAGKFGELDTATQKSIVFGAAAAALAGPALLAFGQIAAAIGALLPVFAAVRVAAIATWAAVSGPLAPLTLAILGAAAAIALAWESNFGHIREVTAGVWETVKSLFSEGVSLVKAEWSVLTDFLTGEWGKAWETIKGTGARAFDFITTLMSPAQLGAKIAGNISEAVAKARREADAATVFREGRTMLPDVAAAAGASEAAFQRAKADAARKAAAVATEAKKAATQTIVSAPHIPGLFDNLGKQSRQKLTEAQQQLKEFGTTLRQALTEQRMLEAGAGDTAIRVANQFNLVSAAQRQQLVSTLAANEGLRKQRDAFQQAEKKADDLAQKFSAMKQKTLEGRFAFELFAVSLDNLSQKQRKVVDDAAAWQRAIDGLEAAKKTAATVSAVLQEAANAMSLLGDNSLENQLSIEKFGKAFENLTSAKSRQAIETLAAAKRRIDELKDATERINQPLEEEASLSEALSNRYLAAERELLKLKDTTLEGAIAADLFGVAMADLDADLQAAVRSVAEHERAVKEWKTTISLGDAATRAWADGMATIGVKSGELQQQLSLLKDGSVENQLAWELFGTAIENLGGDIAEAVFELADMQRAIDATAAKRDALRDLAQGFQSVFEEAFHNIDQGFGGFARSIISGVEKMIQDIAARFLAAKLTNLLLGLLPGGADFLGGLIQGGTPGIAGPIPGRALGGPVNAGQPFLVGERGPELFIPQTAGRIEPNAAGAGGVTIVMNIQTPDANSFRQSRSQIQADMLRMAQAAQRRNG